MQKGCLSHGATEPQGKAGSLILKPNLCRRHPRRDQGIQPLIDLDSSISLRGSVAPCETSRSFIIIMSKPIAQNKYTMRGLSPWALLFAVGLIGWLVLLFAGSDQARAWRALLINFIFFTPLAAGMVTWSAIVTSSNGRWAGTSERLSWTGIGFFVPSVLVLVALWIGSPHWAPWYGKADLSQGAWLNNTFLFIRDIVALVLVRASAVWYLAQRVRSRTSSFVSGGLLIAVYCVLFTLIAFDLVSALSPEWHSTIFGGYFFITSLYSAVIAWTFLVVLDPAYGPELRRDFGNLILGFSILSTYFMFIQLLTIWYENMPDETSYVVHRMNYVGWNIVSTLIVGIVYLGPLVLLLTIWAKRNRTFLGAVCLLLLVGLWFERWWMVAPTFSRELQLGWVELAATAGMLGLFGISVNLAQGYLPEFPVEVEKETTETDKA